MSSVAFGGLATGLDTGSIVSQLVELRRAPIYRLQARRKGFESQIAALNMFKSKLLELQTAANDLSTASEFSSLKSTSGDEDFLTVTAGSDAAPGNYEIEVLSLAKSQKDMSQGYSSVNDSIGQGIMSFTVDGQTTDLDLTGYTNLESLKNMINSDVAGVSASIINDGSGTDSYRLVLSGSEAGSAGAFSVDMSGISGGVTPTFTNEVPAADASLIIDGLPVTASSNNSDEVISGLTLNLLDAEIGKKIQVKVEIDDEGISEKVKNLVDKYNDLYTYINEQNAAEGDLKNNPTLRSVASRMESIFSTSLQGGLGDITMFAEIGISRGDSRQLKWDEADFKEALSDNFGAVRDLFVEREGNLGKSYLIDTAIEDMTDSIDGLFKISTDSLNKKIEYADQGITRYERSIESYQTSLERRFTAMEMMVSQLQAQGSYLTGINQQ